MATVNDIVLEVMRIAPGWLAEEWDNVGLLVGDGAAEVQRVMTCLTVTPATAAEAIVGGAGLVVAHHPMPFRPLKRLTGDTTVGRLLLDLIAARVAVCSAHTAFDSAELGINARLAEGLGLVDVAPLLPVEHATRPDAPESPSLGTGRIGRLPDTLSLAQLSERLKRFLDVERLRYVGLSDQTIERVAVGCGAAGSLLDDAIASRCDCMVLGETNFHTCLEAEARGVALLLPGHYASERFAMTSLAAMLAERFPSVGIWPSRDECDPVQWG